ncbi:hypothetical protein LCGC14_0342500 [marine sediment metagenome]|uniref:Uncharacterized protein n=1 Tax=marine sediment metagenome TaxID=412755 RepID=A0A0F9WL27_9ZZZZ
MNILNKIESFEYDKNRHQQFGVKSAIIWGNSKDTNGCFPILYISKPKHISQEDYELLLDSIDIQFIIKGRKDGKDNQ